MKNIELKAKAKKMDYPSLLKGLGAEWIGADSQEDIYFHTRAGRLKLRHSSLGEDSLIWYQREDAAGEKESLYRLMPVGYADELERVLQLTNGIRVKVKKVRHLYLLDNVRIHLDEVEGLGSFIEIEAVVGEKHPEKACRALVKDLIRRFQIKKEDILPASYSDMLLAVNMPGAQRLYENRPGKPSESEIRVYVDGSCKMNPGPGGYAFIIKRGDKTISRSGGAPHTTNNRMEMTALIEALENIRSPERIKIFTDSQYLMKGMTRWISNWQKNRWMNADKKPVKNKDLWLKLADLSRPHTLLWEWIKGHSGHPENELCDRMAAAEAKKMDQ